MRVPTLRGSTAALTAGGLLLSGVSVASLPAPVALAAPSSCSVTNISDSSPATSSDLAQEIDHASPGDTLEISGVCGGGVVIDKDLNLVGVPSPSDPVARIVADGTRVVTVMGSTAARPHVTVRDLRLTGGSSRQGAGVLNTHAVLVLSGSSAVAGNSARRGGGVFNDNGRVVLADSARVSANRASGSGGGILSKEGTVRLVDAARAARNLAVVRGGGILSIGTGNTVLRDEATVRKNLAKRGGGIQSSTGNDRYGCGSLTIRGSASVSGNHASTRGGGIYHSCKPVDSVRGSIEVLGHAAISNNSATWFGGGMVVHTSPLHLRNHASITNNTSKRGAGLTGGNPSVLTDHARVVGNAASLKGGGVFAGTVIMKKFARVTENLARNGAGVANYGTVQIRGSAAITHNVARLRGGGIWSAGRVVLANHAGVRRNQAQRGGGIMLRRPNHYLSRIPPSLRTEGSSAVAHNVAQGHGGGVLLRDGAVRMHDRSSVVDNRAGARGGGILNIAGLVRVRDDATVSRNHPDDCVGC